MESYIQVVGNKLKMGMERSKVMECKLVINIVLKDNF